MRGKWAHNQSKALPFLIVEQPQDFSNPQGSTIKPEGQRASQFTSQGSVDKHHSQIQLGIQHQHSPTQHGFEDQHSSAQPKPRPSSPQPRPELRPATPCLAPQCGPWGSLSTHSNSSSSSSGALEGTNLENSRRAGHPDGVTPASWANSRAEVGG